MKPQFFTDTHINKSAVDQLRSKGIDIIRCEEIGMATAADIDLLRYASHQKRVIVSCDADFQDLHFIWMNQNREHGGILWLHPQNHCKNPGMIVKIILFVYEAADYELDLYNQLQRGETFT